MIRGLNLAAQSLGIEVENDDKPKGGQAEFTEDDIPMMYRAQVEWRCSLQFAGPDSKDLEKWREEWIDSSSEKPRYQKALLNTGLDDQTYRILVKFPFRLISNCGNDSIIRPIMGKDGIPLISGSSVKGLFRRACDKVQVRKYCGFEDAKIRGIVQAHQV